jgi:hypothetical protein
VLWRGFVRLLGYPWRALRAIWLAVPGDAIGWTAMRICGVRHPTREIVVDGVHVKLVEDPRTGRLLDHQTIPLAAQTLGRYVFSKEPLDDHTRDHEVEHVRQWRRLGPLFEVLYFGDAGLKFLGRRRPYADNRFEVAAERRADADRAVCLEAARRNPDRC